jgi:O-succinylbenzoate synthase
MQQIKDELASPKESSKEAGTPSTLKDSIEKLREKYNKASPATQTAVQASSVESRLKELSDEITKLKVTGGL